MTCAIGKNVKSAIRGDIRLSSNQLTEKVQRRLIPFDQNTMIFLDHFNLNILASGMFANLIG